MGQTDLDRVKMTQSEASETLSFSCSTVQICSICSMFNFVQFVQCSNLFNLFNVQICSICSMFKFVQIFNVQCSQWSRIVAVVSSDWLFFTQPPQPQPGRGHVLRATFTDRVRQTNQRPRIVRANRSKKVQIDRFGEDYKLGGIGPPSVR